MKTATIIIILIINTLYLSAQWQRTELDSSNVYCISSDGINILAGTNNGLFMSINNGISWTKVNNGLYPAYVTCIGRIGTKIFSGTNDRGIFVSTNNCSTWTQINNGLTSYNINAIATSGTNIFIGTTFNGVYKSTNDGGIWTSANNGLPTNTAIRSLSILGAIIFAGTDSGVYLSTNNGDLWFESNNGIPTYPNASIPVLANSGTNILAGTNGNGIYISYNNGGFWTAINNGLPVNAQIHSLLVNDSNIFAGLNINKLFLSTNNGGSWLNWDDALSSYWIRSLIICQNEIFAGTSDLTLGGGVWKRNLSELGISENISKKSILLYPNPSNGNITIRSELKISSLTIYNIFGIELHYINFENLLLTNNIDLSFLPKGIYYLKFKYFENTHIEKFILQ